MSAADLPAEPTPPASPAADDAYHQSILREILDNGMQLIRESGADATASIADKVLAYERISRTIRRTITLCRHIAAGPAKRAPHAAPTRTRPTRDSDIALAARDEPPDRPDRLETIERLEAVESVERLETVNLRRGFFARPIPEIIAALERDLRPHPRRPRRRRAIKKPSPPGRGLGEGSDHLRTAQLPQRGPP